jgi:hypothetical protein
VLLDLQHDFRRLLLGEHPPALAAAVMGDGLSPEARLRVYRNHVVISLREALRATFPVVCRLVGDDFFAGMARAFTAAHPPVSPCLFEYGAALGDFIEVFAPASSLPYLADVARLEWTMNAAYHAKSEPPIDPAILASADPDALARSTLLLQPSLHLVISPYPVDAIWRANQPDRDGAGVDLGAGGCRLLVWRQGDDAVFQPLDAAVATFVGAALAGQTLASSLEQAAETAADFDPGAALAHLLSGGLVIGLSPGAPGSTG